MSFYLKSKYKFSDHVKLRIKQRLKLNHLNDLELKMYCVRLIETASTKIAIGNDWYVKIDENDLYFIISKQDNIVKTITPISPERLLGLLTSEDDNG